MMTSILIEYVQTKYGNKLSTEQYRSFNMILNAFPETLLFDTLGNPKDDVIDLLALLAKLSGKYRELILGMTLAHSPDELRQKILELEELPDSNPDKSILENYKMLLIKYVYDFTEEGINALNSMTQDNQSKYIMERFDFFKNERNRLRYKGSRVGISQIFRDMISYDVYSEERSILIDFHMESDYYLILKVRDEFNEDYANAFNLYIDWDRTPYGPGVYFIDRESILYKTILMYVPQTVDMDIVVGIIFPSSPLVLTTAKVGSESSQLMVSLTNNNVSPQIAIFNTSWSADGTKNDEYIISIPANSTIHRYIYNPTGLITNVTVNAYFQNNNEDVKTSTQTNIQVPTYYEL